MVELRRLVSQWHMVPHKFPEFRVGCMWAFLVLLFPFYGTLLLDDVPEGFLQALIVPNCLHFKEDHLYVVLNEGTV